LLALFLARTALNTRREQLIVLVVGSLLGFALGPRLPALAAEKLLGLLSLGSPINAALIQVSAALIQVSDFLTEEVMLYILGGVYAGLGVLLLLWRRRKTAGWLLIGLGGYLFAADLVGYAAHPIALLSRSIPRGFWSNAIFQFSEHLEVFFQTPTPISAIVYSFASVLAVSEEKGALRLGLTTVLLGLVGAMCFQGKPLALVGTPYIIVAAFAVRSLPASVRAGVAALQQIDPSIEEASNILGADAQYTFRRVTLPLILPAFLAGLIFSFTRHMTSLSAIIFLVSARWRIVTASILSEWEQGGISVAAAYSTTIIILVLIAIGVLYLLVNKILGSEGEVDLSLGA
jgi:iron(III) transport system permease protein